MPKKEKKGLNGQQWAIIILYNLFSGTYPKQLEDWARKWYFDDDDGWREAKDRALEEMFMNEVEEDPEPNIESYAKAEELLVVLTANEESALNSKQSVSRRLFVLRMSILIRVAVVLLPIAIMVRVFLCVGFSSGVAYNGRIAQEVTICAGGGMNVDKHNYDNNTRYTIRMPEGADINLIMSILKVLSPDFGYKIESGEARITPEKA